MKKIDFIYFDAGGGHRSAAMALRQVIAQQERPWEIRLVNLQEQLDNLDIFRRVTGVRLQDYYNLLLKKGWTLGSAQLLTLLHLVIRMFQTPLIEMLREFWRAGQPDLVVSLIPNFNRALYRSLNAALPGVPLVTILTDIADYPPHFWIEPQPQYLICGSDRALAQARAMGHTDDRLFRASGMILNPRFYEPVTADRVAERRRLGLSPDLPTGLVMFGGEGSSVMLEISRRLQPLEGKVQLILVCGHNEALAKRLRAMPSRLPRFVEGFTREIPYYMHLSDFFIGKPGPGSLSEAIAMKLPVIVERNAWNLPQERYNCDWVREQEVGIVLKNFRAIAAGVEQLLEPAAYARLRANAAALSNRAVFEIPDMLERILTSSCASTARY